MTRAMNEIALFPFVGCSLRILEERDVPALFDLIEDNRDRLREWLAWVDDVVTEAHVLDFVRDGRERARAGVAFIFGVWLDEDLTGIASLQAINRDHGTAAIGYWIGRAFTGRGLARRSAACLTEFGFGALELNRIEIRCALENLSSQRVPQSLGFVMEGTARGAARIGERVFDQYVYAKLRDDRRAN